MATFCTNCGSQLPDDTRFCPSCGTPVAPAEETPVEPAAEFTQEAPVETPDVDAVNEAANEIPEVEEPIPGPGGFSNNDIPVSPYQSESNKQKSGKKPPIALIAIGVVAVILIVFILKSLLGGGYKKPVNAMEKYIENPTFENFEKAWFPPMIEDVDEDDIEDGVLTEMDKIKVSFKITDKDKVDKDDIEDLLVDDYYLDDDDAEDVTAAYKLKVEYKSTIEYDGKEKDVKGKGKWLVVKYEGKWYVVNADMEKFWDKIYDLYYD